MDLRRALIDEKVPAEIKIKLKMIKMIKMTKMIK